MADPALNPNNHVMTKRFVHNNKELTMMTVLSDPRNLRPSVYDLAFEAIQQLDRSYAIVSIQYLVEGGDLHGFLVIKYSHPDG